jgi:hypothetical protein
MAFSICPKEAGRLGESFSWSGHLLSSTDFAAGRTNKEAVAQFGNVNFSRQVGKNRQSEVVILGI